MYLKRIQLQGFKSFSDKTIVEFKDGITGIVGPNGSGKSNISDAIRWALGEQSTKMLRSNKMEDVIFAGSEKRKALGFAEVILVFDNTDGKIPLEYTEVSIKRKVYRSGESEYSINNSICRLKDVRDLFMDTGIGKDGYSIIGQGKIDEILSSKPEERRAIFEEAAGIIKYKTRKEESERKLGRTEENVLRIKDILSELNKRYDYLKVESEKAVEYKDILNELNSMELDLLVRKIKKITTELEKQKIEEQKIRDEKQELEKNIDDLRRNINKNEVELNKIDENIREYDIEYNKSNEELLKNNNEKTILEESKRYSLIENERLNKEIEESLNKIKNNNDENSSQLEKNKELKEKLQQAKENYNNKEKELKEKIDILDTDEKNIEDEKNNMILFYNKITDKKGELANLENFKKTVLNQSEDIQEELKNINEDRKSFEKEIEILKEKEKNEKEIEKKLKEENTILKNRELDLIKIVEDLKKKSEENNIAINMNRSQYNMNKNMQENYEGYYKSVKALMVNSKRDKNIENNIVGVIADLIEVKEEYTKAIDISLGSNIQNIVTPDENSAKYLINYLKSNNLGRATFLPINIIKGKTFDLKNLNYEEYGIIGLGSEIIDFDIKYKDIIENLLGRVVVTKNMDYSIKLAKKLNHSVRIVTLEGDLINPGGSMTGGSIYAKGTNLLGRKNILKELEDEELSLIKSKESITIRLEEEYKNYNEIKNKLIDLEENLKENSLNILKYNNEIQNKLNEYSKTLEKVKKLDTDYEYFNKENLDMIKKIEIIEIEISKMETDNENLKENINILVESLKNKKTDRDELSEKITSLRIEVNTIEEEFKYNEERLKNLIELNKNLDNEIIEKQDRIKLNKDEIAEMSIKIENILEILNKITEKNKNIQENKIKLQNNRDEINKELNEFKKEDLELYKKLEDKNQKLNNNQQSITRNNVYYENYIEEIRDGFNLEYSDNIKENHPDMPYDQLNSIINKNKKNIEKLGVVNLGSIEEFDIVKERLEFMNAQVADLERARKDLLKIIKEMNEKMELKFISSFKIIRKNFNEVFKILFNGGKADILIEDEDNILDSGIEIMAQPPGKKFQSLSLLSGGERSLTAVALLFSILEMKPAPFCILDEIDAALDESNIDRYTNYLKRFSDETQFIMITHRKRTMEIADMIYGVTMEDEGVSKTISIELSELEENIE